MYPREKYKGRALRYPAQTDTKKPDSGHNSAERVYRTASLGFVIRRATKTWPYRQALACPP